MRGSLSRLLVDVFSGTFVCTFNVTVFCIFDDPYAVTLEGSCLASDLRIGIQLASRQTMAWLGADGADVYDRRQDSIWRSKSLDLFRCKI